MTRILDGLLKALAIVLSCVAEEWAYVRRRRACLRTGHSWLAMIPTGRCCQRCRYIED